MIILGIDPSVRGTGYAVIEVRGKETRALTFGRIYNAPALTQSQCLKNIYQQVGKIIEMYHPDSAALEGIIYVQNRATAIALGAARGAAMVAIAENNISIHEYPARSIKKATTGYGKAAKNQVGFMMRAIFKLTGTPNPDAADALAIALTHAQSSQWHKSGRRI
ncbi:MAG: crossover junction endodeoxyribonuclease RuvC [Verrucomicrobiota bacterium]